MHYAARNITLATATPECGLAFDGSATPANIVAANIYDALMEYGREWIEEERNRKEDETETES